MTLVRLRRTAGPVTRRRRTYRGLLDPTLGRVLAQAAAVEGLDDEVGATRFALARLLAEEGGALRLATGVARLALAATRAARARHALAAGGEL